MLRQLNIQNFAIIDRLELDFDAGLTCITGETGAGKSILLDALSLCLGERSERASRKDTASKTALSVEFSVQQIPEAQAWLKEHELDDEHNCLLRRTITQEGRSKSYINGQAVTLSQVKKLAPLLLQVHDQHAHQTLTKADHQRELLNCFLPNISLLDTVSQCYAKWRHARLQLQEQLAQKNQQEAQQELLQYQLHELNQFQPVEGEYELLEKQHTSLSHQQELMTCYHEALEGLSESPDHSIQTQLSRITQTLQQVKAYEPKLTDLIESIQQIQMLSHELCYELTALRDQDAADPAELQQLEQRMSAYHDLARKHKIMPDDLHAHHQYLIQQREAWEQNHLDIDALTAQISTYKAQYFTYAHKLFEERVNAAKHLSKTMTEGLKKFNMPHAEFEVTVAWQEDSMNHHGSDVIGFRFMSNLGQSLQPIQEVASGGELSRIGLMLQVLTSKNKATPTLIFDEVDTGISGATADIVGKHLKALARDNQILCITHLPQVACQGHQHLLVEKAHLEDRTATHIKKLNAKERAFELARLLAGNEITDIALANAKQLLHMKEAEVNL